MEEEALDGDWGLILAWPRFLQGLSSGSGAYRVSPADQ